MDFRFHPNSGRGAGHIGDSVPRRGRGGPFGSPAHCQRASVAYELGQEVRFGRVLSGSFRREGGGFTEGARRCDGPGWFPRVGLFLVPGWLGRRRVQLRRVYGATRDATSFTLGAGRFLRDGAAPSTSSTRKSHIAHAASRTPKRTTTCPLDARMHR